MRNIELEKELQQRMKRREGYSDRYIKHKDKVYKYSEKDSKHKGETDRIQKDEYHKDDYRDYKHKEYRYRDDVERDRHRTGWARDDTDRKKRSREDTSELESKNLKDISHRHTNWDDRVSRHTDNKDVRSDINKNKDENSDYRSRSIQDQHVESKKYRTDAVHEERARHSFNSYRDLSDKVCVDDLSAIKRLKSDSQLSPLSTNKISSHMPPQPPFNLGRSQTNWNNFPNLPYIPFHHVPPPMFNPFMYQSLPPMLTGPPMNMNHVTIPYHFTGDRFGNWDHGRTELKDHSFEPDVVSVDFQSAIQKHEDTVHEHTDEISSWRTGPHIEKEDNNLDFNTSEVMKVTPMDEKDDDALISRVYLSKIDVSKDLTRPEIYDQCKSMLLDSDQASSESNECDYKILFLEEGVEDDISNGTSLFAAVDDSIFMKAMSIYTKQKVHFTAMNTQSVGNQEKEHIDVHHPVENQEKGNIEVDHLVKDQDTANIKVVHPVKNQETENREVGHPVKNQEPKNIEVEHPVTDQETENTEVDHPVKDQETENIEGDHPVENQETESCAPSVGDCEIKVKVNYDGSKEVDDPCDGGSFLVLTNLSTNALVEFGSVNLSRMHSPE